jgi:hypothetical protein
VADEDLLKKARAFFMKRNRILHRFMYPETSIYNINKTLSAAWDSLPGNYRQVYIAQVMYHVP